MANCPKCSATVKWLCCHDTFTCNGKPCVEVDVTDDDDQERVHTVFLCTCGQVLGSMDNVTGDTYSIDEFRGVNWLEDDIKEKG